MNQEKHSPGQGQTNNEANLKTSKQAREAYQAQVQKEEGQQSSQMPKVDLNTFVLSMSSSVLVHLGEVPDPDTGQTDINLDLARHSIDILSMLEAKTKGNLSKDEEDLLKNILFELRMKYVQKAK